MNLLSAKYDALSTEIRESPRGTREGATQRISRRPNRDYAKQTEPKVFHSVS